MFSLLIFACSTPEITAFPSSINFGEVNFRETLPPEGYAVQDLQLKNTGTIETTLSLVEADELRLCFDGIEAIPSKLSELEPEATFTLRVGVCDYIEENAERDSELSGALYFDLDGQHILEVPWSFTPVLEQPEQ